MLKVDKEDFMKITQVSYSDNIGGASRAAFRIHLALRNNGIDSRMRVEVLSTGDWTVESSEGKFAKVLGKARPMVARLLN